MLRCSILLLLLFSAPVAGAQNRLTNGDFDVDVSGWSSFDPISFAWDSFDVDANPGSGSLDLTTFPPPMSFGFFGVVSECVSVTPGEVLAAKAWVYLPSGQIGPPQASISVQHFASPFCQPLDLVVDEFGPGTSSTDQWVELAFTTVVPVTAQTAHIYAQARNTGGGIQNAMANYDAVYLPEPSGPVTLMVGAGIVTSLAGFHSRKH